MDRKEAMELWRDVTGGPNTIVAGRVVEFFATRVAEREREACARICEEQAERSWAIEDGALFCAEAIRTKAPNASHNPSAAGTSD